jgi:predicted transcriptional regulator
MKTEQQRLPRFAVLIDADNTSPQIASGLFEEVAKFGEASVRRIYGDFSNQRLKSWTDILQKYAIDPYQQFAYTTGKNASDIALVIDAMDLLHSGRFDGFCLVSSDSDFTRLASRLREQGADVYGFGAQKTPESFRQACRRFIYTENLVPQKPVSESGIAPESKSLQPPSAALPILKKAISQAESEDGWVRLDFVGSQLTNLVSDFDVRTYGFTKLSDLVRNTGMFDVEKTDGNRTRIRAKPKESATGSVKGKRTRKRKVTGTSATQRETRRAALEASIARGLADADAGRVKLASEVFDDVEAKLKAKTTNPRR